MSSTTRRDYLLAEIRRITREKGSCWKRDAQQLIKQLESERDPFARLDFAGTGTEATGRKYTAPRSAMDSGSVDA